MTPTPRWWCPLNGATYLKLPAQSSVPARGSGNASPKDLVTPSMGQGTQQGVLWGQGSFEEEAISALSSKEQGVGGTTRINHTQWQSRKVESWRRACPVAPRTRATGGRPVPCWRDVGLAAFVLLQSKLLGFGVNTQWCLKMWLRFPS